MPSALTIVVALVARDHDSRFNGLSHTNGFKDVNRPHHIRRIGFHGILVRGPHERLRGHVEDDFRSG